MDLTKGSLSVPRDALISALLRHMGPPQMGNSIFILRNFWDLTHDRRNYCLLPEMAKAFIEEEVNAEPWVEEVCDCDSRTICFWADCVRGATRRGWKQGLGLFWLNYTSKTLAKPHAGADRMEGYHKTPLIFVRDLQKEDIVPMVLQPPVLLDDGRVVPAQWQEPLDEVNFWVVFGGLT